ncbi:hypothetical protein ONE63_004674 [Megalurothrips usitatus]|uniref:MANSC domain-containing protein n=1 Tax=Megalurothrips usitatus TaxID=439358 RepID=A0AAV7X4M4_9NEOP|nr:hypothetical protein ONE63_004674 [Megalurothrips usitatus]
MSGAWLLALATVGVLGPPAGASLTAASILRRTSPGEQGPASAPGGLGPLRVSKRYDLDLQTCVDNFDVQRDQIIRTQDSKRMGAVNLAVKDVLTRDECLRLCCETDKCDVFVFEEKQSPGTCYMFHCGPPGDSRCKFTRHESYTTGILDMTRRILDQHEQDLNSLRILLEPTPSPLAGVRLLSSKTGPVMTAPGMASSASSSAAAAGVQTQGECGPGDPGRGLRRTRQTASMNADTSRPPPPSPRPIHMFFFWVSRKHSGTRRAPRAQGSGVSGCRTRRIAAAPFFPRLNHPPRKPTRSVHRTIFHFLLNRLVVAGI